MVSDTIFSIFSWLNNNAGVVSVFIFIASLLFGWLSGIFGALRRKPNFKLKLIDGPTFCCTYLTDNKYNGYDTHRTAIALYLSITNIGSAPSSIEKISIGYHCNLKPFSLQWLRYSYGWFWLNNRTISLSDFQTEIGENVKVYPFLFQVNALSPVSTANYLQIGQSTQGVVYYEQQESWGGFSPKVRADKVHIKVCVKDTFGNKHIKKFVIPSVSLLDAKKFNPSFGDTYLQFDKK